jgi:hypothetical protein
VAANGVAGQETCIATEFGLERCVETYLVEVKVYEVESTRTQTCLKGKSAHTYHQEVTSNDTHQVTEYQTRITTYLFGTLTSIELSGNTVDVLLSSKILDVGKCQKTAS